MKRYTVEQVDKSKARGKCRKWRIRVRTDERYPSGRFRYVKKQFEGTLTEATAEAQRWADAIASRSEALPSRWTFDEWAAHVDDAKLAAGAIAKRTHDKNSNLRAAYRPHIGGVKICDLTPAQVDAANIACRNGETRSGRPLSGTTLSCMHTYGWGVMDRAVKEGLATRNPFDLATRPKPDTAERKALGIAEEAELALSLDPEEPHHMALVLMMEAGLRRGECCALRWRDVEGGRIVVSKSLHDDGEDHPTKNGKSRVVPITSTLARALEVRKAYQARRMEVRGTPFGENVRVLADETGEPLRPCEVTRWWTRNRAEFGMDGWTPHEFRHTFCSNLAEADVHPRVMQQLMGHSSERTCLQVYTHVHDGQLDAAIEALSAAKDARKTPEGEKGVQ